MKKCLILLAALFIPTLAFGDIVSSPNYWKKSGTSISYTTGNVGVGTSATTQGELLVFGADKTLLSGAANIMIKKNSAASGSTGGSIAFADTGSIRAMIKGEYQGGSSDGQLRFATSNAAGTMTENMRIGGTNGNIGIGTTTVTNGKLTVAGAITPSTDNTTAFDLGTSPFRWANLNLSRSINISAGLGNIDHITVGAAAVSGSSTNSIFTSTGSWNTSGSPTAIKLNITNTASGSDSKLIDLQTGSVSKFNVGVLGNVGISSTTPTELLDVAGTVKAIAYKFSDGTNASPWKFVSTTTLSAVTNSGDITIDPTKNYMVILDITSVAATGVDILFNNDTGANYDYAVYGYSYAGVALNANSATGTSIRTATLIPNPFVKFMISAQRSAGTKPVYVIGQTSGGTVGAASFGGEWAATATLSSFRIITNAGGNMDGSIHLYQLTSP